MNEAIPSMPSPMGHIMVDLETMSTGSNAAIVAIGAVEFDLNTGQADRTFYCNVHLQSCIEAGLQLDGNTVYWWMSQEDEARKRLLENPAPLSEALAMFSEFVAACGGREAQVWGNSARFDLGILHDAYRALNLPLPWHFRNERDVRTLVAFAPHIKEQQQRVGVQHDALDDCYHQIAYCAAIWRALSASAPLL